MTRRRRFLGTLALGFAAVGVFSGAAQAQSRPYQPNYETGTANSGIVSKSLIEQHMLREAREVKLAAGEPNYSHLPAEDRAAINAPPAVSQVQTATVSSSGSGLDRSDWMRGIAFAVGLLAATAFALVMARGGMRTAHS